MIHNAIFQTPIFTKSLDGLTDRDDLYNIVDNDVERDWPPSWRFDIIQSDSRHLHKSPRYENLANEILTAVEEVCQTYQYKKYTPEITEMWGNRQRPGTYFKQHMHYNNIFSGVFWLHEHEHFPRLVFYRPMEKSWELLVKEYNPFTRDTYNIPTTKDLLVIFPAWLVHHVPTNRADTDRLGISFNVMLRGGVYNTVL